MLIHDHTDKNQLSGFLGNSMEIESRQTRLAEEKKRPAEAGRRPGDAISGGAIKKYVITTGQNVKYF